MVGRAGRSKGCATCRRRRRRCDLERPVCGQCKNTGRICEGYSALSAFYNTTGTASGLVAVPSSDITLRHSFNLAAFEQKYVGLFCEIYLPSGLNAGGRVLSQYAAGTWIIIAQTLSAQDSTVRKAFLAVCLGTIVQKNSETWLQNEAVKLYAQTVEDLRLKLEKPSTWHSDGLLVVARALAAYELLHIADHEPQSQFSQAKRWSSHHLGQSTLIAQRRPSDFVQGHAHRLFVDGRMQLAIAAIVSHKTCFLSDPAWKTVPWQSAPKTRRDTLLDILVEIPSLIVDVDILNTGSTDEQDAIIAQICEKGRQIDAELNSWHERQAPNEADVVQLQGTDTQVAGEIIIAQVMSLFWTACLITYNTLRAALVLVPDAKDARWSYTNEKCTIANIDSYCQKIADVVDILVHPAAGVHGSQYVPFPVACSLAYLLSTQGLESELATRLLGQLSMQMSPQAIQRFVLGAVKEWPSVKPNAKRN